MGEYVIQVKNIEKQFKSKRAVDGISFDVKKGEVLGILGPNGAGKTTTLRMLSTLIKPSAGSIFINGINALENPMYLRESIGFLTGEMKLDPLFTPDYLYDFYSELYHVKREVAQRRKQYLFAQFNIEEFAHVKVQNLSTGMKQKASLAISMAHDPSIIIYDEPTNGLDVLMTKTVVDFLIEVKNSGQTIIVSTHIFDLIERICDRIIIMVDGRVALQDNIDHILANKSVEDVFFECYTSYYSEEERDDS